MYAVRANLKKVGFWRVTGATRPLPIMESTVEYRSPWLCEQETQAPGWSLMTLESYQLALRECDCGLAQGEDCCCPEN